MRVRAYCAHLSICDHWALRCISRCPDPVISFKRDLQCLSPKASLVLIYRPITVWIEPGPVAWECDTLQLDHWAFTLYIYTNVEFLKSPTYPVVWLEILDLNPGEDMNVCKCVVPLWHGITLTSRRATCSLRKRGMTTSRESAVINGVELSKNVLSPIWSSKLQLTTGVHLALFSDEFRGL
ncbi:hypothetical protein TNCV_111051 [Trichonephila clavipes]|nr:hypothetical protein TNCV_111051 [Trichonephila clavipes]